MSGRSAHKKGRSFFIDERNIRNISDIDVHIKYTDFDIEYENFKNIFHELYLTIENTQESINDALTFLRGKIKNDMIDLFSLKVENVKHQTRILDVSPIVEYILSVCQENSNIYLEGFNPNFVKVSLPEEHIRLYWLRVHKIELQHIPKSTLETGHMYFEYTHFKSLPIIDYPNRSSIIIEGNPDFMISKDQKELYQML